MATPKLDDRNLRDRLLDLVRAGHGRYGAAIAVGITTETYRRYYAANPDFREEVEAAIDASVEPIIKMLRDEAEAGDITAAKEYLKHAAPPPRSEKKEIDVTVTHELDPATINTIDDLRARLEGRTPALPEADDIIEGEVIDETP
jgi:hypothetical protein